MDAMMDGKRFWVPDSDHGFKIGKLVDIGADSLTIEPLDTPGKTVSAAHDTVYPCEEYIDKDVDDNCALMYLNEGNLLNNLRLRYKKDAIYVRDFVVLLYSICRNFNLKIFWGLGFLL
jgi:myosin-6